MIPDRPELIIRDISFNHISSCRADYRAFIFFDKTDTLLCRIRSLVELSRKEFNRKAAVSLSHRILLSVKDIYRRFCKYPAACFLKCIIRNILHVIPDQHTDSCHIHDPEITSDLMTQFLCRNGIIWLLFYKYTSYTAHIKSPLHDYSCLVHSK